MLLHLLIVALGANLFCRSAIEIEKNLPVEIDAGLLAITDLNPVDSEAYTYDFACWATCTRSLLQSGLFSANTEAYLAETAREGIQLLLNNLFSLPTTSSADGPLARLPKPTTLLPRAKSLPKPKPPTKWEKFAAAKGIDKRIKDKKVWDEEKQDWVDRWGRAGKNKEKEEQWIQELPDNARMFFMNVSCSFLWFRR